MINILFLVDLYRICNGVGLFYSILKRVAIVKKMA